MQVEHDVVAHGQAYQPPLQSIVDRRRGIVWGL
jgi:hypothetical protein